MNSFIFRASWRSSSVLLPWAPVSPSEPARRATVVQKVQSSSSEGRPPELTLSLDFVLLVRAETVL